MKKETLRIAYRSRKDVFSLYPIGDIHAGTTFCAEDKIRAKILEIKNNPHALWIGMGDYCEFIPPNDKRFDGMVIADWVDKDDIAESQSKWMLKLLDPIKDKCIGLMMGNHETYYHSKNNHNIFKRLYDGLDAKNLGFSCFYRLNFSRGGAVTTVTCHFEHGSGGAQTEGGKAMRLYKSMSGFEADIYGVGHLHDVKILPITYIGLTEHMEIKAKTKVGCLTGCWYRTYADGENPSYAEQKGYSPTNLGCPVFEICPDKRTISAVHSKVF